MQRKIPVPPAALHFSPPKIVQDVSRVVMSNQRSFKIGSFRFAAFVPKKIECERFYIKILDRNQTFSVSSQNFWTKSFCFVPFPKIF
jgi:hypothetical protein